MTSLASCEARLGSMQINDPPLDWTVEDISIRDPASYMLYMSDTLAEINIDGQCLDEKHREDYGLPQSERMLGFPPLKGAILSASKIQAKYSSLNVSTFQESAQAKSTGRGRVAHFPKNQTQHRGCSLARNTLRRIAIAGMTIVLGATISALL